MKTHLLEIHGWQGAINSMFMSKRTWSPELQKQISDVCNAVLTPDGIPAKTDTNVLEYDQFCKWIAMVLRMSKNHITVGKFISFTGICEGLHRAGQDDFDAHACRLWNRIIRNSTRLATFSSNEKSEFYQDKIMLMDESLSYLGIDVPEAFTKDGKVFIRSTNGYILDEYRDDKDVKRGLYPLCIPSNFDFECSLTEWAHIEKERCFEGNANPEVKLAVESFTSKLIEVIPGLTRQWFFDCKN